MKIVPVLLAGGSGTRLWPVSREGHPKQFLRLTDEQSLLQHAASRALKIPHSTPPMVICNDAHRFLVAEQLRQMGVTDADIVLEPEGRNTAPAATVASLLARQRYGEDVIIFIMAADHLIADAQAFQKAVVCARGVAESGFITTFGIVPNRVETGYGYLRKGEALPQGGFKVASFVEKPDKAHAQQYVDSGEYLWNGGMFLFRVQDWVQEISQVAPDILSASIHSLENARRDLDFLRLDGPSFLSMRSDSIDYAVMEKTGKAALMPMDAGWNDVGAWPSLDQLPTDARGNYIQGDVQIEDSANTLVYSRDNLVVALGVQDLMIVSTRDAVLVARKDRAQDVKQLVEKLKAQGRAEVKTHPLVHRPWGSYEVISSSTGFKVKRIIVNPGSKLSLQQHQHRAEHWIVVSGTADVTCDERRFSLKENESTFIPLGARHRLENSSDALLELIEVQSGAYLEEDDIVRFEDAYRSI